MPSKADTEIEEVWVKDFKNDVWKINSETTAAQAKVK